MLWNMIYSDLMLFCFFVWYFCCFFVFRLYVRRLLNGWDCLKQNDFHVNEILVRSNFANEDLNTLHKTAFANILWKLLYAKFVHFWPNDQILNGFNFVKLLKIHEFLKLIPCENYFCQSKLLRLLLISNANPKSRWIGQYCWNALIS